MGLPGRERGTQKKNQRGEDLPARHRGSPCTVWRGGNEPRGRTQININGLI